MIKTRLKNVNFYSRDGVYLEKKIIQLNIKFNSFSQINSPIQCDFDDFSELTFCTI